MSHPLTHTKAPWTYEERCSGIAIIHTLDEGEKIIATILSQDEEQEEILTEEDEANAKLIAAAPELLEALEMANNALKATYPLFKEWPESQVIESTIAKAKNL